MITRIDRDALDAIIELAIGRLRNDLACTVLQGARVDLTPSVPFVFDVARDLEPLDLWIGTHPAGLWKLHSSPTSFEALVEALAPAVARVGRERGARWTLADVHPWWALTESLVDDAPYRGQPTPAHRQDEDEVARAVRRLMAIESAQHRSDAGSTDPRSAARRAFTILNAKAPPGESALRLRWTDRLGS